jgi:ABC-type multidrug transport system ATPase subunit
LPDAERLCDQLVILKLGDLVYQGTTENFVSRADQGSSVTFKKGGSLQTITASSTAEAQKIIDAERKSGAEIIEVRPLRLTLEEAFMRVAFDKERKT